jgi:hypothetical protein
MKKTILVQTDLTVNSLNTVKVFFEKYASSENTYDILLLTGYELPNSITDLLFISKSKILQSVTAKEFREALNIIKNKFDTQLNSARVDIFTGYTQAAFNQFLELNEVDEIYTSNKLMFNRKLNHNCFNITNLIRNSDREFREVDFENTTEMNYFYPTSISSVFEGAAVPVNN